MNRKIILEQIKTDLEDNLTVLNGYTIEPTEVKRGVHSWNDFAVMPVVCFSVTNDTPAEANEHGEDIRVVTVIIYMYSETDKGNTDQINDMVYDIQNFLKNKLHYTYSDLTLIKNIEIREGGISTPQNGAWVEIEIFYDSE